MSVRSWVNALTVGALAVGLAASVAEAKSENSSPCKGLEQKACSAKADCSWISATTRKDGRKVKAYCRLKSRKSTSAEASKK